MRLLLLMMFISSGSVWSSQIQTGLVFDGGWEYQVVTEATRSYFKMPQRVIGVFNNKHQLPDQNSTILMRVPRSLTWKEATFSVIDIVKKTNSKLMIKSSSYSLSGGDGNVYVSEYLWTPVNKSQIVSVIHIKRGDAAYLLLTDLEESDYRSKKTVVHGLALEIYRRQNLVFPSR